MTEPKHPRLARRVAKVLKYYGGGLWRRVSDDHTFLLASGIAFNILICVVPLVLLLHFSLGLWLNEHDVVQHLDSYIEQTVPVETYGNKISDILQERLASISQHKTAAGVVGAFGLLWTASALIASLRIIINSVFGYTAKRSFFYYKMRDIVMVIILGGVVFALSQATIIVQIVFSFVLKLTHLGAVRPLGTFRVADVMNSTVVTAFVAVLFFLLYKYMSYQKIPLKALVFSSLFAALMWEVAKRLFTFYIGAVTSIVTYYGEFAYLVVGAIWIYYSTLVLIMGAEAGSLYLRRRLGEHHIVL